ncbi:MAG: hypothetical protein KGJ42_04605 [Acidobacteriota bacterium]|nr:hypothetical protein [Acidobacteriota bacterium]MDE3222293.1 hypothetical protein [Acidobacteriota bacterium]
MIEFVPWSPEGRHFAQEYRVRLGDVDARGIVRVDGIARYLQDIATDDWEDTGVESSDVWVVRRTSLRLVPGARWPTYLDAMRFVTWCGGVGAAWAERRTNVYVDEELHLEAVAIWVPTDHEGRPVRMRPSFFEAYGEGVKARKVSGRVVTPPLSADAPRRPWPLRRSDVDIVGHVNNAALWEAVHEMVRDEHRFITVIHHGSVEWGDDVTLAWAENQLWLVVNGEIRVSATYGR